MADRFAVVGLARSRSTWFGELARWSTAGVAPIDFVKCLTNEEARAVMGTGRQVSALLVDAELPRFDRGLVTDAERVGAPTILVGRQTSRDWESLGCAGRLDTDFSRDELVDVLERVARRVTPDSPHRRARVDLEVTPPPGRLVGVLGSGGVGTSSVAMWLAQATADAGRDTVLVDGCRRADLAMYHDVGDVLPGLPELVDLHRGHDGDPADIRSLEFDTARGYRLVLGLRRPRDWAGLRPAAVAAALHGLRRTHANVVVDLEPDLESERDTGSGDIEDRHALALEVARTADAVVVVGGADMKGVRDTSRLLDDVVRAGTPSERVVVVINRAPRSSVARIRTGRTLRSLLTRGDPGAVVFVRHQRGMSLCHETADRLPLGPGGIVLRAVTEVTGRGDAALAGPDRVRIGDLGTRLELTPERGAR